MLFLKNIFFLCVCTMIANLVAAQQDVYSNDTNPPKILAGYKLAWHDEFNKEGKPDSTSWVYENGFVRNEELQWYQPANANCVKGSLVIEGRKENIPNPKYRAGSNNWKLNRPGAEYTSSSIQTRGHHQWQFGRFEIRARIDTAIGSWPAIWTLGVDKDWPSNGEIDIMEFYRVQGAPTILANTAWGTEKQYVAKWHTERIKLENFISADADWVKKFHVWRMDWTADSINLYLDDALVNSTPLGHTLNADGSNGFLQPHYLLLNLALGGNGGKPVKPLFKYEVDYVRVYQKNKK